MDEPDALDPAFALPVLVIQISRVYDALITLIRMGSPEHARQLVELHESGRLASPAPKYIMDEE